MKRISINVEFIAIVNDDVEEADLTFSIPVEQVRVESISTRQDVGRLEKYTTGEYWEVIDECVYPPPGSPCVTSKRPKSNRERI